MKDQIKINDKIDKLENALQLLDESIKTDYANDTLYVDGAIQRFEFCFELFWRIMKLILHNEGIEANSPRQTLEEALQFRWIEAEELWALMLDVRNETNHIYKAKRAQEIYQMFYEFVPAMRKTFALLKEKYYHDAM